MTSVRVIIDIFKYIQAFILRKQSRYCFINSAAAAVLHHCHGCLSSCCIISGADLTPTTEAELLFLVFRGGYCWLGTKTDRNEVIFVHK